MYPIYSPLHIMEQCCPNDSFIVCLKNTEGRKCECVKLHRVFILILKRINPFGPAAISFFLVNASSLKAKHFKKKENLIIIESWT